MKIYNKICSHIVPDVLEPTTTAVDDYKARAKYTYGGELTFISENHIAALRAGKLLAFSDGEYLHYLIFGDLPEHRTLEEAKENEDSS